MVSTGEWENSRVSTISWWLAHDPLVGLSRTGSPPLPSPRPGQASMAAGGALERESPPSDMSCGVLPVSERARPEGVFARMQIDARKNTSNVDVILTCWVAVWQNVQKKFLKSIAVESLLLNLSAAVVQNPVIDCQPGCTSHTVGGRNPAPLEKP